jgi:hypothetical protein
MMKKWGAQTLGILTLGVGLALFFFMTQRAGLSEISARVRALGAGFVLIIGISSLRIAMRALAWKHCLASNERGVGFWPLLRARLIGDAAGQLFVAGPLIAEPARLAALGAKLTLAARVKSLAVETLTYTLSSCLLVLIGILALGGAFAVSDQLRFAGLLTALTMVAVIVITVVIVARRWTILSSIGEVARRLLHMVGFSRRWKRQVAHLQTLEHHVFSFYREHPRDLFIVSGCELLFHLFGIAETWVTLELLGFTPSLLSTFTLEATNRAINMVFSFVPGRIGVDEAGTGLLTEVLGLGGVVGVTLAIVRKARILVWTILGVGLYIYQTAQRTKN